MSVHIRGIGPDGQWLTKAERDDMRHEFMPAPEIVAGDALARLEAWRNRHPHHGTFSLSFFNGYDVRLWCGQRTLRVCERSLSLSAAIHAALDQWEAT